MTKGPPDKILKCCIPNSIPGIDTILSNLSHFLLFNLPNQLKL